MPFIDIGANINRELRDAKSDLGNCEVMTFSKFICNWFIQPFFPILSPKLEFFNGYSIEEPPENSRNKNNGYIKKAYKGHYVDDKGRLYLNRISELITSQDKSNLELMYKRIQKFIDLIIIDEYQDLTGKDFDLLKLLVKQQYFEVILTGDLFQAGVSKSSRRKESKLLEFKNESENMEDFLKEKLGTRSIKVILDALPVSRRISIDCAKFVSVKLGINIESYGYSKAKVHLIKDTSELFTIASDGLTILTYNKSVKHNLFNDENYNNWSYVKGDTCDNVLVVLTKNTDSILTGKLSPKVKPKIRNMLYVALTRAKGELYLVSALVWKEANFN